MELVKIDNSLISYLPNIKQRVIDVFGNRVVSLYNYVDDEEKGFIIMSSSKGLLLKESGEGIIFSKSMTGSLGSLEKMGYIIKPRINYDFGDELQVVSDVSIADSNGTEYGLVILPSYEDDGVYKNRVCFTQYDKSRDTYCEINYDYMDDNVVYSGLLNRIESVHIIEDYEKKGITSRFGLLSRRIKIYSRSEIDSDTLNYSFVSFNEHGVVNTLMNGSYKLYNGANYLVRFCKIGYMNLNKELVELPWPLSDYKKEEDIRSFVEGNGFMYEVPEELICVFNNQDKDVILLQEFLRVVNKYKNNSSYRRSLKLSK